MTILFLVFAVFAQDQYVCSGKHWRYQFVFAGEKCQQIQTVTKAFDNHKTGHKQMFDRSTCECWESMAKLQMDKVACEDI